jgi:hypothetical protein
MGQDKIDMRAFQGSKSSKKTPRDLGQVGNWPKVTRFCSGRPHQPQTFRNGDDTHPASRPHCLPRDFREFLHLFLEFEP